MAHYAPRPAFPSGPVGISKNFQSPASSSLPAHLTAPSKKNDCYFYYYSSCSKGPACPFRHEPAALNQETVCSYWKAGNCTKPQCIFR